MTPLSQWYSDFLQETFLNSTDPCLGSLVTGGGCRCNVSEHLKKIECEKPPTSSPALFIRQQPELGGCTAALRGRLAWKSLCVPLPGTCDMDASRLGSGPPDTVINGTRFSPHLILLLSELSGPKTIINSQSSVNPLTRSFHPTRFPLSNEKKRKRDGVRDREEVCTCVFGVCVYMCWTRQTNAELKTQKQGSVMEMAAYEEEPHGGNRTGQQQYECRF